VVLYCSNNMDYNIKTNIMKKAKVKLTTIADWKEIVQIYREFEKRKKLKKIKKIWKYIKGIK